MYIIDFKNILASLERQNLIKSSRLGEWVSIYRYLWVGWPVYLYKERPVGELRS